MESADFPCRHTRTAARLYADYPRGCLWKKFSVSCTIVHVSVCSFIAECCHRSAVVKITAGGKQKSSEARKMQAFCASVNHCMCMTILKSVSHSDF